jgi:hypothetical protein
VKKIFLILVLLTTSSYGALIPAPINSGEVKISYPCFVLPKLMKENEESQKIIFYEKEGNALSELGLNYRYRVDSSQEEDITFKFRPKDDQKLLVQDQIYSELSMSNHGELKCEADVIYDTGKPKFVSTCSFKSSGKDITPLHGEFLKMVEVKAPELTRLREVVVKATKWKLITDESFFKKRPTIEVWRFRNECILEVSAKFEGMENALPSLKALKSLIKYAPSPVQGNKTSRVLQTRSR